MSEYHHRRAAPPVVTFNGCFKKTGRYRRTIYWRDTGEYVAVFEFRGNWNHDPFKKEMVFRLTRSGRWEKVHSYREVYL